MYRVKLYNKIAQSGLAVLEPGKYQVGEDVADPEAILVRSASLHEETFAPSLRAIARAGAGVNNIPIDRCTENGIAVFNTPGANANAVKELAIAALLLASRKIVDAIEWAKTLSGDEVPAAVEKGKSAFVGPELFGKTLGVVGFGGAIGRRITEAALGLGMNIVGYDPYLSDEIAAQFPEAVVRVFTLSDLYEKSDYITLHLPVTPETKGMINRAAIADMKNGARLLNLSRADLVDDKAVLAALQEGKLSCYVTDFPNGNLVGQDKVIAIPHLGASTPESEENCAIMAAQEITDYLEHGNVKNSVNLPNLTLAQQGDERICIIHSAAEDEIVKVLVEGGAKIAATQTAKKRDLCYTVVDVFGTLSETVVETMKQIEGIRRVRVI